MPITEHISSHFCPVEDSTAKGSRTEPVSLVKRENCGDLVHDLRQPLSAIEALAYYIEITSSDDKTSAAARRIQDLVMQAGIMLDRVEAPTATPTSSKRRHPDFVASL